MQDIGLQLGDLLLHPPQALGEVSLGSHDPYRNSRLSQLVAEVPLPFQAKHAGSPLGPVLDKLEHQTLHPADFQRTDHVHHMQWGRHQIALLT